MALMSMYNVRDKTHFAHLRAMSFSRVATFCRSMAVHIYMPIMTPLFKQRVQLIHHHDEGIIVSINDSNTPL